MNTEQPLAIALADELDRFGTPVWRRWCSTELRRLHQSEREGWRYSDELEQERKRLTAENEALREALRWAVQCVHFDEDDMPEAYAKWMQARAALARAGEKT